MKNEIKNQKASLPFQSYQAASIDLTELSFQALLSKMKTKHASNQIYECNLAFEFNKASIYHIHTLNLTTQISEKKPKH